MQRPPGGRLRRLVRTCGSPGLVAAVRGGIANTLFGGTAEYVALWFKDQGMERGFYWYVTAMIGLFLTIGPLAGVRPERDSLVARDHVDVGVEDHLAAGGLVLREAEARTSRGRPRMMYAAGSPSKSPGSRLIRAPSACSMRRLVSTPPPGVLRRGPS